VTDAWSFADPENLAVITLKSILHAGSPILHVVHDAEDGGWQFLGWDEAREDDATIVALRTVARLDPSIPELSDLPLGWHAWRRGRDDRWRRAPLDQAPRRRSP